MDKHAKNATIEQTSTVKKLIQYALNEKKLMMMAFFILILAIITELIAPLIIMEIMDTHLASETFSRQSMPLILRLSGFYFGMIGISAAFTYIQRYILGKASNQIVQKMREDLFTHIQTMPIKYFDDIPAGQIVARITNDTESLRHFYINILTNFVAGGIGMIGVLIALYVLNVRFALICTLIIPCLFIWIKIYRHFATGYNETIRTRLAEINGMINEIVSGISIIQIFRQTPKVETEFEAINEDHYHNRRKMLALDSATSSNILAMLRNFAMLAVIWFFGGRFIQENTAISVGLLYIFIDYIGHLFRPVMGIVGQLSTFEASVVSARRVFELMTWENEPLTENLLPRPVGEVKFEHVHFAYEVGNPVLKDISLSAKSGETVALVGHTGSGKSSIMSALFGFYPYQQGRIMIDGKEITEMSKQDYRQHMGIVLQDPYLFAGTIKSNISLDHPAITCEKVEKALEAVGAMGFISKLPNGIDAPVLEGGSTFSTGERQLLSFARALAFDPAVLILDEATANIDTETEKTIQKALDVLKKGRTTFIIAHRLSTIRDADQILVLDQGEIVERGNHQTLMALYGKYHQMYQLQRRELNAQK